MSTVANCVMCFTFRHTSIFSSQQKPHTISDFEQLSCFCHLIQQQQRKSWKWFFFSESISISSSNIQRSKHVAAIFNENLMVAKRTKYWKTSKMHNKDNIKNQSIKGWVRLKSCTIQAPTPVFYQKAKMRPQKKTEKVKEKKRPNKRESMLHRQCEAFTKIKEWTDAMDEDKSPEFVSQDEDSWPQ